MRIATLSATGRQLAVATVGFLLVGATFGSDPGRSDGPEETEPAEIACGGYAEDGELLRPEAASVTHAHIVEGRLTVPPTCGGYTEGGEFVGDD